MRLGGIGGRGKGASGGTLSIFGAAACAILAGIIVTQYMRGAVETTTVYVAAHDLSPGMVLQARDLRAREIAASAVPEGAVTDPKAVEGKRMKTALIEGDFVREGHFTDASSDVSAQLAQMGDDYRAMMLSADILPAMDRLTPGDYLELTAVLPVKLPGSEDATQAAVFVTHGTVIDVLKSDSKVSGLLLAVKEEAVPRIALALRLGTVTASFLPAGVEPQEPENPVVPLDVFSDSVKTEPPLPPSATPPSGS